MFFITEFVDNGNLHELICEHPPTWKQKMMFANYIARGMTYLHQNDPIIIHRDLKSLNVLVSKNTTDLFLLLLLLLLIM